MFRSFRIKRKMHVQTKTDEQVPERSIMMTLVTGRGHGPMGEWVDVQPLKRPSDDNAIVMDLIPGKRK
jgi:hypothetical protein